MKKECDMMRPRPGRAATGSAAACSVGQFEVAQRSRYQTECGRFLPVAGTTLVRLFWLGLMAGLLSGLVIGAVRHAAMSGWPAPDEEALGSRLATLDRPRPTDLSLLRLLNEARQRVGRPALRLDRELCAVASSRSRDMIARHYFSHHIPGIGSVFTILDRLSVSYGLAAENLATNNYALYVGPDAVLRWTERDWLRSADHRRNMLDRSLTDVGIGLASNRHTGQVVITEIFTGP